LGLVFNWGKVSDSFRRVNVNVATIAEQRYDLMQDAMKKTFETFEIY
jgi:hypothetical protein